MPANIDIIGLRLALKLTQEQLAERLGVTRHTINRWEMGHHKPLPMAKRLLEIIQQELINIPASAGERKE